MSTFEEDRIRKNGTRVVSKAVLGGTAGMLIAQRFLDQRQSSSPGVSHGIVPGHGGDAVWVQHDNGAQAAYLVDELRLEAPIVHEYTEASCES